MLTDLAMSRARVDGARRIAVLRANAVGDFVLTLPALLALRMTYPDATLTLLGLPWHADFLQGRDSPVDDVIGLPPIAGLTADNAPPDASAGVIAELRARRFDLVLQLHGGGLHSNPFVRALGAGITAGFRAPEAVALDRNLPYHARSMDLQPRALLMLECVKLVGAATDQIEPRLCLRVRDTEELRDRLPGLMQPYAVLQPGANDGRRRWAPGRFAAVGDLLHELGATVVVHGGPGEASLVREVCSAMHAPAVNAAGRLSVGGLCALLAGSRLLVSNDTGPAHLARALGVPTVTIYWIGNVCSYGPLSSRLHRIAASYRIHCPACGRHCILDNCEHRPSFVDDVTVDQVGELAAELYAASPALETTGPWPAS